MSDQFNNDIPQKERREILESDRRARKQQTYFGRAEVGDELGGRFVLPEVPPQPPHSPWSQEQPTEPPIGININYVEPMGTLAEQKAAAAILAERQSSSVAPRTVEPAPSKIRRRV